MHPVCFAVLRAFPRTLVMFRLFMFIVYYRACITKVIFLAFWVRLFTRLVQYEIFIGRQTYWQNFFLCMLHQNVTKTYIAKVFEYVAIFCTTSLTMFPCFMTWKVFHFHEFIVNCHCVVVQVLFDEHASSTYLFIILNVSVVIVYMCFVWISIINHLRFLRFYIILEYKKIFKLVLTLIWVCHYVCDGDHDMQHRAQD